MKLKVYEYKNCETCRKALKFLTSKGVSFTAIPIREQPPTPDELRRMLRFYQGNIRKLFNTSGRDYQALRLKERLATMSEAEAVALLASNGNLVKRPFVVTESSGLVGFDQGEWEKLVSA